MGNFVLKGPDIRLAFKYLSTDQVALGVGREMKWLRAFMELDASELDRDRTG